MNQNVTLKLDKDLLRHAKVYATRQGTSLSRLMAGALRSLVTQSEGYERARRRAASFLRKGWKLGGGPYYSSRDTLHRRDAR